MFSVDDCYSTSDNEYQYDNHWIFGHSFTKRGLPGFDFTHKDSVLSPRYMSPVRLHNGTTVMSDRYGNLQYYSNGISIPNKNNQPVEGSECFNSNIDYSSNRFISNQSILSLPSNMDDSTYYIFDLDPFHVEGSYYSSNRLSVSTIDMAQNNGEGKVVNCNELIIDDILLTSTMQATRHANGVDWWIIVGKYGGDEYYKVLFGDGVIKSSEVSSWGSEYDEQFRGQSVFSPDGNYYSQVIHENQEIIVWEFDNATGDLFNQKKYTIATIDDVEYPRGCSFSPDSRFLYVSSMTQIRQFDLCDFNNWEVQLIDTWDGSIEFLYPLYFGKMMMTPDQQIIVAPPGNSHYSFGLIQSPNEKGLACNFGQGALQINERTRNSGDVLPVFPHYRSYPNYDGGCNVNIIMPIEDGDNLVVYPNPVNHNTFIALSKRASGVIYDVLGKEMSTFTKADLIDVHHLNKGTYFIKSDQGDTQFIKM